MHCGIPGDAGLTNNAQNFIGKWLLYVPCVQTDNYLQELTWPQFPSNDLTPARFKMFSAILCLDITFDDHTYLPQPLQLAYDIKSSGSPPSLRATCVLRAGPTGA